MTDQPTREVPGRDVSRRKEREKRILDATEELLQKWGYRKTTLEDIARQARVTKGTIYLSWKTREALFMAVIERAETSLLIEITQQMAQDPEGMTLFGMVKHSMLAALKNPVMRALVLQDSEFLGELITHEYSTAVYQAQMQEYMLLLALLRDHGLIRNDSSLLEQTITVSSVSWGFLLINPLLLDDFKSSDEQMVTMVVSALKRLLEPDIPPAEEQRRAGQQAFKAYMEQRIVMSTQQKNETETQSI